MKTVIYDRDIDVVYEDEYLAVVNKPAGLITNGNFRCTLQNCLSVNLKPSNKKTRCTPKPMHRLDSMTGGLVLIGKTRDTCIKLGKQFENHTIQKRYRAINRRFCEKSCERGHTFFKNQN